MTHIERARAWLTNNCVCECPEKDLAALLAQVTNEALERAAELCELDANGASGGYAVACENHADTVRSLKVSP